jgi:hypothetical protein
MSRAFLRFLSWVRIEDARIDPVIVIGHFRASNALPIAWFDLPIALALQARTPSELLEKNGLRPANLLALLGLPEGEDHLVLLHGPRLRVR